MTPYHSSQQSVLSVNKLPRLSEKDRRQWHLTTVANSQYCQWINHQDSWETDIKQQNHTTVAKIHYCQWINHQDSAKGTVYRRWHLTTEGQRPSSLTVGGLATPQRQRQWTMTYILPQQANSQVAYCRSTGQNAVSGAVNTGTLSQTGHGGGNSDTWARLW